MSKTIVIHHNDTVGVALEPLLAGDYVNEVTLLDDIPQAHKFALKDIKEGEDIIKYGLPIGHAITDIKKGQHVHVHNIKTNLNDNLEYSYTPKFETLKEYIKEEKTFEGYVRKNGDVGIRNELWIIPTVGCVNGICQNIAKIFKMNHPSLDGVDGVYVFTHPYGCSQMGDDHVSTRKSLQNLMLHPNAGGVLVVGLGCENNQMKDFKETSEPYDEDRVSFMVAQEEEDEIAKGVELLEELYAKARLDERSTCPVSKLKIGLKCGGSDGLSGVTANPLLGLLSDYITSNGGTCVLTEVPEMFGAETILMNRAENEEVYNKIVNLINNFKEYYRKNNQVIYENPSPGNKKGGITTLEDKSCGCTQKAGSNIVRGVLDTNERISVQGLNLLRGPGNDLVATSLLGMSGCQMVLFTTGRGTPFGGFIPTVKISTNSNLANAKPTWIDFNAGQIVEGKSFEVLLNEFVDYVLGVASGNLTNNEINDFHEIAIFKTGVTL